MSIPDEIPQGTLMFFTLDVDSPDDLTTSAPEIGLSSEVATQPSAWWPATWPTPGVNTVRTAVPVDTASLQKGFYQVWLRVNDFPEHLPNEWATVRIV